MGSEPGSSGSRGRLRPFRALFFNEAKFPLEDRILRLEYFYHSFRTGRFPGGRAMQAFYQDALRLGPRRATTQWLVDGKFLQDLEPHFYLHQETFTLRGRTLTRTGLIAALTITPDRSSIFDHEQTFPRGIQFHLHLLEATHKNFEPVLLMYNGSVPEPGLVWRESDPFFEAMDSFGHRHRYYRVRLDPTLQEQLESATFVVADGHHRIEASRAWAREHGPCVRLVELVPAKAPQLVILPTHRIVPVSDPPALENLRAWADLEPFQGPNLDEAVFQLQDPGMLLVHPDGLFRWRWKPEILKDAEHRGIPLHAPFLLHELLLPELTGPSDLEIGYERNPELAVSIAQEQNDLAFLLPFVQPMTVFNLAIQGKLMPHKSTDFYPKLLAGPVILDFVEP